MRTLGTKGKQAIGGRGERLTALADSDARLKQGGAVKVDEFGEHDADSTGMS